MTARTVPYALIAALTAGCVSVLPDAGPPPDVYRLTPPPVVAGPAGLHIEIAVPSAGKALSGDRVVVSYGPRVAYASGVRWESVTPRLIQSQLIAAFDADDAASATRPSDGVRAPYELRVEILAFEAAYADEDDRASPQAVLNARVRLIDNRTRALVGSRVFDIKGAVSANRLGDIVAALDAASDDFAQAVATWAFAHAEEAASRAALDAGPVPGSETSPGPNLETSEDGEPDSAP